MYVGKTKPREIPNVVDPFFSVHYRYSLRSHLQAGKLEKSDVECKMGKVSCDGEEGTVKLKVSRRNESIGGESFSFK